MADLATWRTNLKTHLREFAALAQDDRSVNLIYGITAAAVLWHVRDAPNDEDQLALLRAACDDEHHVASLKRALGGWDAMSPLEAARALSQRQRADEGLHAALEALLGYFLEDLFAENMLKQGLTIEGDVIGANVLIGSQQVVAGDLIIQYIRQSVSSCPSAPNPPAHFTGREKELDELRQALSGSGAVAITAVRSMGGMGKTALAKAFCHHADNAFDAVLWADIGEEPQATSILLEWARYAVDDYELKPDAKPEEIAAWVRAQFAQLMEKLDGCGKRWLVVFDDVWNKQLCYDTVTLLQTALPPGVKTLITTRQVDAATALRARSIELYELSDADALALLQRLRDNRHLTDEHLQRAVSLIKGHPLTLEIAIASLNNAEDADDIDAILNDYERGIRDGSPFDALNLGVETPRMLNVVFGRSYEALHKDDQRHFRALGILTADSIWERPLIGALWKLSDQDAVTKAHKVLRLAALIQQDEEAERAYGGIWYRQHPLLRTYARALLHDNHETDAAFNRYAEHIIQISQQFDQLPLEQWHALAPHIPHIHAVGDALAEQLLATDKPDDWLIVHAGAFSWNTTRYLNYRPEALFTGAGKKRQPRRLAWFEMGLRIWRALDDQEREAITLNNIGGAWSSLSEQRKALDYYEQALQLLRVLGDSGWEAVALNNIGQAWARLDEQRKALEYYEQALQLRRAGGDRRGEAVTLNNIGQAWSNLGEKRKALEYFEQALSVFSAVGDRGGQATTLNNIGGAWHALGEPQKALEYLKQTLPILHAVGDRRGQATTLNNIGQAWSDLGEHRKALENFEQALPVFHAVGDRRGEATALNNIGIAWSGLGEKRKGLEYFEQALPLLHETGNRRGEAVTLNNIGQAWSDLGEQRKALAYFEQALPLRQAVNDRGGEATTLTNIGSVWSKLGEKRKALEYYERALPLRRAASDRAGEATTLHNIGSAWSDLGEQRKALEYFEQALRLRRTIGDRRSEAVTLLSMSVVYHALGDLDKAIEYLERCVELEEQVKHPNLERDRQVLERLKRERDGVPTKDDESSEEDFTAFLEAVQTIYTQGGAGAVRTMLKGHLPNEVIEAIIAQLEDTSTGPDRSEASSALAVETFNMLVGNTVAVKTNVPEKLNEWWMSLRDIRADFAGRGADWEIEVAFADALLAVLGGQPVELPENNPYSPVVRQVVEAIEEFQRNQP